MIVLMTASTLPRWDGDSVPAFVLDQARALRREHPELEIHLLAPHDHRASIDENLHGIHVHRFRYFWPARWQKLVYPAILPNIRRYKWLALQVPFLLVCEFFAILRFCIRRRPDVIYSHWFMPQGLTGGLVACLLGIPHVFTSHSSDVRVMRKLPALGPWLVRVFVRRMHACTVVSRRTLDKLKVFFPAESDWESISAKVRILPMGIDIADYPPLNPGQRSAIKERLGVSGKIVVLFIGRLSAKKGLRYLLEAFASVAADHADIVLLIAGDGEEFETIRGRVGESGLNDRIRMPGYVTGELKREYLQCADIMTLPSVITADNDAEGLPVALLEGLAAGAVCIATDVSGADDILTDGEDGFIVPQRDPDALAAALRRAIEMDAMARRRMLERARHQAMQFDWVVIAQAHYDHLFAGITPG